MDLVTATREINSILQQLETSTGRVVDDVRLNCIDVTGFEDREQVFKTTIIINLKPAVENKWAV